MISRRNKTTIFTRQVNDLPKVVAKDLMDISISMVLARKLLPTGKEAMLQ